MEDDDRQGQMRMRADLFSLELLTSVMLAGAAMADKRMLARMHATLTDRLSGSAAKYVASFPDTAEDDAAMFEVQVQAALDRVIGTAKAMR